MAKRTAPQKFSMAHDILADADLSASAKVVAVALLLKFHNSKTGRCNPSMASIAAAVGRSRRAVFPSIEELVGQGRLKIEGTKGGKPGATNTYRFLERVQRTSPVTGEADDTPTGAADYTGEAERRDGCSGLHPNREEPLSPSERESGRAAVERAPDGALEKAFQQVLTLWQVKPHGVNVTAAWKAFQRVCEANESAAIVASANRWVSATPARWLPKLEGWLDSGAWQNNPPARTASSGRNQKSNPVDDMLNAGGFSRYGE